MEFHVATLGGDEVPNPGIEFVAGVFKTGVAVFFEFAFVDDPSFEAGVVGTRDVPSGFAFQTIVASKRVLESDGEAVTNMEVAVSVRRRHNNRKSVFFVFFAVVGAIVVVVDRESRDFRTKDTTGFPGGVNIAFILPRFITTREFHSFILT